MQKNYETFSAAEFLEDAFFIEWVKYQTPESEQFWISWMEKQPSNLREMQAATLQLKGVLSAQRIEAGNTEAAQVWNRIENTIGKEQNLIPIKRAGWWVAAAAVIIVMLGTGGYFWFFRQPAKDIAKTKTQPPLQQNDIAPGGNKAILTLADGSKVILDTTGTGAITKQGNVTVIKLNNGQLAYNKEGVTPTEVLYNTITTPRGGQYQLVLADGTKVWLNAASSLRFPTAFIGKERRVEMSGEGYFEVAHDASKPFHVNVNGMDVQVLGTHFNINSYSDEPEVKTTLLEGRVMIKKNENLVYLNPGQQAIVPPKQDNIKINYDADVEEAVAWKNGKFIFNGNDIHSVMRQLSRWYDVHAIYEDNLPDDEFVGIIPRTENISAVLKLLQKTKAVSFKVAGKSVTVMPYKAVNR